MAKCKLTKDEIKTLNVVFELYENTTKDAESMTQKEIRKDLAEVRKLKRKIKEC